MQNWRPNHFVRVKSIKSKIRMANSWYGAELFAFEVIRVTETRTHSHIKRFPMLVMIVMSAEKCGIHTPYTQIANALTHSYKITLTRCLIIWKPFIEQKIINAVSQRFFFFFPISFLSFAAEWICSHATPH